MKFPKLIIILVACSLTSQHAIAQLAKGHVKFLGNIVKSSGTGTPDYNDYWNQVTPENIGKWGVAEPVRDQMDWAPIDSMFAYAESKRFPVKQHAFVWGIQEPSWISGLSATAQREEVEEWIRLFGERYGDRVQMIDVVNEPLHAPPSFKNAIGGDNGLYGTGWDWVIWTFEKARQYCPNAKLLLNDYDLLKSSTNANRFATIVNLLRQRGLIDGIGEQAHFLEGTSKATIESNLAILTGTGVDVYISELDFNFSDDTAQKNKYETIFPVFWENPAIKGVTLWGYKQGGMWRTNAYLIRSDGSERPALQWLRNYIAGKGSPRLEAEEFDSQQGVQALSGFIAYVDNNDWIRFNNVNLGTGYNQFSFRYAKGNTTVTRVEVRIGSVTGTKIGELATTNTGGWSTYSTRTGAITGGSGSQDIYFVFKGGLGVGNFDWFQFSTSPTAQAMTAEEPATTSATFSVYPNPASDRVAVEFHGIETDESVSVSVTGIAGDRLAELRQTVSPSANTLEIPLSALGKGHYLVTIRVQGKTTVRHLYKD